MVLALGSGGALVSAGDDGTLRTWPAPPPAGAAAVRAFLDGLTFATLGPGDRLR